MYVFIYTTQTKRVKIKLKVSANMNIFGRSSPPPKWSAEFCGCGENPTTCKINTYSKQKKVIDKF